MRERCRVDNDDVDAFGALALYALDQFVFGIRLHRLQMVAAFMGLQLQGGIDLVEGGGAVGLRLASAEQVEVRSMQNENRGHAWLPQKKCSELRRMCSEQSFPVRARSVQASLGEKSGGIKSTGRDTGKYRQVHGSSRVFCEPVHTRRAELAGNLLRKWPDGRGTCPVPFRQECVFPEFRCRWRQRRPAPVARGSGTAP